MTPVEFFGSFLVSLASLEALFRIVESFVFIDMFSFEHQETGPLAAHRSLAGCGTGSAKQR